LRTSDGPACGCSTRCFEAVEAAPAACCDPRTPISRPSTLVASRFSGDGPLWQRLRAAITDKRRPRDGERPDRAARDGRGSIAPRCPLTTAPKLVTFQDVTDTVNVERAAAREERSAEESRRDQDRLRAPRVSSSCRYAAHQHHRLAHLPRRQPGDGPLNEKQREYLGYIRPRQMR